MCECQECKCTETDSYELRIYIINEGELYAFCRRCDDFH